MNHTMMVAEFMKKYRQPSPTYPHIPPKEIWEFRLSLIEEEVKELREAFEAGDIYLVADALADIKYVVFGTDISCGIVVNDSIFEIVHKSNMTKPIKGEVEAKHVGHELKVQKGGDYRSPTRAIREMIDAAVRMGKPKEVEV